MWSRLSIWWIKLMIRSVTETMWLWVWEHVSDFTWNSGRDNTSERFFCQQPKTFYMREYQVGKLMWAQSCHYHHNRHHHHHHHHHYGQQKRVNWLLCLDYANQTCMMTLSRFFRIESVFPYLNTFVGENGICCQIDCSWKIKRRCENFINWAFHKWNDFFLLGLKVRRDICLIQCYSTTEFSVMKQSALM